MRYAIVTEEIENGGKYETVISKKGAGYIEKIYINGEFWSEHKIYNVDGKPYVRAYRKRFYFDGEYLEALRSVREAV